MATWDAPDASFDATVCLYALIHVPLEDQRQLFPRLRRWLATSSYLQAIVGPRRWTGVEPYLGADMFWDHEVPDAYLQWLRDAGLEPRWTRFIPEGDGGHTLVLAQADGGEEGLPRAPSRSREGALIIARSTGRCAPILPVQRATILRFACHVHDLAQLAPDERVPPEQVSTDHGAWEVRRRLPTYGLQSHLRRCCRCLHDVRPTSRSPPPVAQRRAHVPGEIGEAADVRPDAQDDERASRLQRPVDAADRGVESHVVQRREHCDEVEARIGD